MSAITQPEIMNYDPNMTLCGRMAKQTVRLTFGQWQYRGSFDVVVRGNITGLDAIRSAVENLYEDLPSVPLFNDETGENDEMAMIHFGKLVCTDEDLRGDGWLGDMLISAEIISIEPEVEA